MIQLVLLTSAFIYTKLNEGRVIIDIEIKSNQFSRSQVYWDIGNAFNNKHKYSVKIKPGYNRFTNLSYNGIIRPQRVRLDPLTTQGTFEFIVFKIKYADCIYPLRYHCRTEFIPGDATYRQQIIKEVGSTQLFTATAADPYFIWDVPERLHNRRPAYVVNAVFIFTITVIIWMVIVACMKRKHTPDRVYDIKGILLAVPFLLLYPVLYFLLWLASLYVNSTGIHLPLYMLSTTSYFVYVIFNSWKTVSDKLALKLSVLIMVSLIILPDFMFHLGILKKWPTDVYGRAEYHWQIGRKFSDNVTKSSLNYIEDINHIAKLMPSGSIFLSDSATSYYLTSSLDVFARNPMYHHRISANGVNYYLKEEEMNNLCTSSSTHGKQEKIKDTFKKHNITFLILNQDKGNPNVARSCLTGKLDIVMENIKPYTTMIFRGGHLLLYKTQI